MKTSFAWAISLVVLGSAARGFSADDSEFVPIDLKAHFNHQLADGFGTNVPENNLSTLPKGESVFEDCNFDIGEGVIQLGSTALDDFPDKVTGIKVNRKVAKLHFLHATQYGGGPNQQRNPYYVQDGTKIGEYRVSYDDHSESIIPIVYGEDVRDWFFVEGEKSPPHGKVVWTGDNDYARSSQSRIRLYETTWENPSPDKTVTSIDYSSKKEDTPAAPFCIAITTESSAQK
jgi:beta-galactosidase